MAELLQEEEGEEGELKAHGKEAGDADSQHAFPFGSRVEFLQVGKVSSPPPAWPDVHAYVVRFRVGPQGTICRRGGRSFRHTPHIVYSTHGGNDVEEEDDESRRQQEKSGREEGDEHSHDMQTFVPFYDARAVMEASHVLQSRASSARVQRDDNNDTHKPGK